MATDIISRQQLAASFRGVPFLVRSERQDASGKRHIPHEYPNSNRRYIEDLGEIPSIFSIDAFVHGQDYLQKAAELEEALRQDGPGTLSMPNFGTQSVFAMPFTKSASQKAVGEISFGLTFQIGTDVTAPAEASASEETVFEAGDEARAALNSDFADLYEEPFDKISVETSTSDILLLNGIMFNSAKDIASDLSKMADVNRRINEGVANLAKNASELAEIFFGEAGLAQETSIAVDPNSLGISSALNIAGATNE